VSTIDLLRPSVERLTLGLRQSATEAADEGYVSLGRSALRHWMLVAVAVVVGLLFGVGAGAVVSPTYTARAELIVGKSLNLTNTAAISGFPFAEAQLAQDYSRLAGTPSFDAALQSNLGRRVQGSASASPVAQSPVIDVYGTSRTRAGAVAIANAASSALTDAINAVNQQTTAANSSLLSQYQNEALTMEKDQQTVTSLQGQLAGSTGATRGAIEQQLAAASAAVDTDRFKLSTLQNQYQAEFNPNLAIEQAVTPLGGAAGQGGNRTSHVEIGGIGGVVAGVLLGLAIAASIDVRADRRARQVFNFTD
jgi:capsular polysaccharide biosynthesis protein